MSTTERILLVRLSHLGDVVHALPVFHALRAAHPRAELAWVVQNEFAGLLRGLPGLERLVVFERRGGARAWLDLARDMQAFAPTWTVDAQGNLKSALATLASGAPRRTGSAWSDWRERAGALVLTERAPAVPRDGPPIHAMQRMLALVEHVAGPQAAAAARFDPGLVPAELEAGRALLDEHAPSARADLVMLQLARRSDVRSWPLEHFATLARDLQARGASVLVLSGPQETAEGELLARELPAGPRLAHWIGQRGLRELAGVFTAAARRGARFVGCDSGPMHLAVACGLRVVALCGPQDPLRTGPWPPHVESSVPGDPGQRSVRSAQPPSCAPCLARTCVHARGPVCLSELEPQRVLAALGPAP